MATHGVFITGGTGYIGSRLLPELLKRGHEVRALVRRGSEHKLPRGCQAIFGNALDHATYDASVPPSDTFVQLVGVAHPSPAKKAQFRSVDFASGRAGITAAGAAGVKHFVYMSVAHPSPMMKDYIQARVECEELIRTTGLNATVLRPWYVLGPGHRWPYMLLPFYWLMERIPSKREQALRLGLVTLPQMIRTLVNAVENPATGVRIVEVPHIRNASVG